MTGFVTKCAYCKRAIELSQPRHVDFTPTGGMVVFHSECEGSRGKAISVERVGNDEDKVTRLSPKTRSPWQCRGETDGGRKVVRVKTGSGSVFSAEGRASDGIDIEPKMPA